MKTPKYKSYGHSLVAVHKKRISSKRNQEAALLRSMKKNSPDAYKLEKSAVSRGLRKGRKTDYANELKYNARNHNQLKGLLRKKDFIPNKVMKRK